MIDDSRQSDLVPADKLSALKIDVIGVGAIGRQVSLQLASIGASELRLIDHDIVDASNVCTQGYTWDDIGTNKVTALSFDIGMINSEAIVKTIAERWTHRIPLSDVVFCCVDNMATRESLHREALFTRSSTSGWRFFIDGRMLAEVGYVYPSYDINSREAYIKTLFSDEEAEPGRCTMRSTIYGANHVASAMVHQFVRWLRGQQPFACGGMIGQYSKIKPYA